MIPRTAIRLPHEEEAAAVNPLSIGTDGDQVVVEEVDSGPSMNMLAAIPPKKNTKRAQVKNRDWRASIQAYNEL